MKMTVFVLATILIPVLLLPKNSNAQTPQKTSTFTVAGQPGNIQILQTNGKSYIEIEALARLIQGTLSFTANQTTLKLPASAADAQASTPAKIGFSRAFTQASIEEMSVIREWRIAIVNAVRNNSPVSEDWVSTQRRIADKDLALAAASVSTDDDNSASPLLSAEYNNMQKLSELYFAVRAQAAFISPDTFNNDSLEQQILNCSRGFVSMIEAHEFQDQSNCH